MSQAAVFVGLGVSKGQLDVALRPTDENWAVTNDDTGLAMLVGRLRAVKPALIALEATGSLAVLVTAALAAAGLPVVVVNPRQARDFAKATGRLAKPDAIDPRTLAYFAEAVRAAPQPLPDAHIRTLSALLGRRRQLVEMLRAEHNHMQGAPHLIQTDIQAHITWLEGRLARSDSDLANTIRTHHTVTAGWRFRLTWRKA